MEDNGSAAGAAPLTVRLAYVPAPPPIKIDTDIPVPPYTRGGRPPTSAQQVLRALEVGHSFLFPESKVSARTINNAWRIAFRIAKETGRKFTARMVIEDGRKVVRVWRVA